VYSKEGSDRAIDVSAVVSTRTKMIKESQFAGAARCIVVNLCLLLVTGILSSIAFPSPQFTAPQSMMMIYPNRHFSVNNLAATGWEENYYVVRRVDNGAGILHIELFDKDAAGGASILSLFPNSMDSLPQFLRPKPTAKAGIRTYTTAATAGLSELITDIFPENEEAVYPPSIALLVYMWVSEANRGRGLGDVLLSLVTQEIVNRKLGHYLMISCDDNGSGKLIEYYKRRGFAPIFNFLERGMIARVGGEEYEGID
jgi:ribosomal protein S18 acetylase RimI-like enzyme